MGNGAGDEGPRDDDRDDQLSAVGEGASEQENQVTAGAGKCKWPLAREDSGRPPPSADLSNLKSHPHKHKQTTHHKIDLSLSLPLSHPHSHSQTPMAITFTSDSEKALSRANRRAKRCAQRKARQHRAAEHASIWQAMPQKAIILRVSPTQRPCIA